MQRKLIALVLLFIILVPPFYCNDTLEVKEVGPGFMYYKINNSKDTIMIHLLKMDLTNPYAKLEVGIANDYLNKNGERTSSMAHRKMKEGNFVIGAVNADFFGWEPMQAQNSMVVAGDYAKGVRLKRTMFAMTDDNKPYVGSYAFDGYFISGDDTVRIDGLNPQRGKKNVVLYNSYWSGYIGIDSAYQYFLMTPRDEIIINGMNEFDLLEYKNEEDSILLNDNVYLMVINDKSAAINPGETTLQVYLGTKTKLDNIYTLCGGLPMLVQNGERPETYIGKEGLSSEKFVGKNPRTAIGFNREKTELFLIEVDGRQKKYSQGMTLIELADFMIGLGCSDVLNLDGGGSSTMTLRDSVVNSPSDKSGERLVYNSLIALSKDSIEKYLKDFDIVQDTIYAQVDQLIPIEITALDVWGFPFYLSIDNIEVHSYDVNFKLENGKVIAKGGSSGYLFTDYGNQEDKVWIEIREKK